MRFPVPFSRIRQTLRRAARVSLLALVAAAPLACATTSPRAEAPPTGGATEVVKATIDAFRAEDWAAVEANLSTARKADLNDQWFALWHAEVQGASPLVVSDATLEPGGQRAQVAVKLGLGGKEHHAAVRVVREGDAWKWDER